MASQSPPPSSRLLKIKSDASEKVRESEVEWVKDSFITQDRNEDFVGGQLESTFSQGHCDLTSGTISKNRCQMKDMDIIFP